MQQVTFTSMGSQLTVTLDSTQAQGQVLLEHIPVWFKQWELSFSLEHPNSEISQVNAAEGQPVRVSRTFWTVLRIALDIADRSEGVISLLSSRRAMPVDWRSIQLDPFTSSIRLPRTTKLDISNIARSWAINTAVQRFAEHGPTMIDNQNEVVVSGPRADGKPWLTELANSPISQRQLGYLMLGSGAAATSNRVDSAGSASASQIIDPRTNQPAQTDLMSTTVIAPDGPTASMAARIMLILGSKAGLPWIEARPHLAALAFNDQGHVLASRKMTNAHYMQAQQVGA